MKAIVYYNDGSQNVLKLVETEKPAPAEDEVLIKVHSASVNPLDYHLLRHAFLRRVISTTGKNKITRPGRDVAGVIESAGRNVTQFKVGDGVFGLCNGSFADYVCARESGLTLKPHNISFEQAAAAPVVGLTALQGLRDKANVQTGQKVLINGAAGGVGTFAVQIAKSFGAKVSGVCSTRNVDMVQSLGADTVIDYTRQDYTTSGEQYDVIFDLVANHSITEHRRALTAKGIYLGLGMIGISSAMGMMVRLVPQLVLSPFISQKFISFTAKADQKDLSTLGAMIESGKITPVIDRCYKLSAAGEAVSYLEGKHARGKVIIDMNPA
jgi:NADPH:quinone reductase-like Zn-dependent oxidoreductase